MASEYGVYTLAEIYTQIFGSAPSNASDLAMIRTYIKGLGGLPVSRTNINQYYMPNDFFSSVTRDAVKALTVPSSSASSAWQAYSQAGNGINQLGAATQGSQLVKSSEIGYFRFSAPESPSGYLYKPASILNVTLPTAAAAIAPLAGVAIGATMYAENPELWTKLSRALIPWAYPDDPSAGFVDINKGLIPVWTEVGEAAGELIAKALLPDALVNAFKDVIAEEGIGVTENQVSYSNVPYPVMPGPYPIGEGTFVIDFNSGETRFSQYEYKPNISGGYWVGYAGTGPYNTHWYYLCQTGSNFSVSTRAKFRSSGDWGSYSNTNSQSLGVINGKQYRYASASFSPTYNTVENPPFIYSGNVSNVTQFLINVATAIELGTITEAGGWPEGTSKWGDGSVYPLPANPRQIIFEDESGNEVAIDAYPVPLPLVPGQSTDPTIQGIDDPLVDISKQVDPYIQRTPDPYTEPAPTPENPNQPGPDEDPSHPSEPSNPISPDGPTQPPPPSDGESPDPTPPIIPPPFTSEGGLIAVYNPPQSTLVAFANWLWVTYQDATIQKIWNNPFDGVISLHELYCTPPVIGTRNIKSGFLDSEISSPIIGRYTEINCGSIVIPEYWGNYLDYAPYSKAFVYLPFIGIIELEADDIVGHAVNITYRVDCYNGSCIAMITVAKQGPDGETYNNTVYQYSGNCAVELPLTGGSQANIKAAIINATAWGLGSVISGIMTAIGGQPFSGAGQAISGAIEATASVVNAKSSVQHSGTFGASFGAMGIKIPYIIIKRPIQVQVLNYNEIYGYQAHKAVTIGSCEGYLRCREVHVTSATANDEEKRLIEQYLKTGVIV